MAFAVVAVVVVAVVIEDETVSLSADNGMCGRVCVVGHRANELFIEWRRVWRRQRRCGRCLHG